MKFKHVLATLTFSLALGLGVFGATNNQSENTKKASASTSWDSNKTVSQWGANLYIRGGMNGWGATLFVDGQYEFEASSTLSFKLTSTNNWDTCQEINSSHLSGLGSGFSDYCVGDNDGNIKLQEAGDYVITWDTSNQNAKMLASLSITKKGSVVPEPKDYSLAYDPSWDAEDTTYTFAQNDDNSVATLNAKLPAGFKFKIVEDYSWGVSYGYSNSELVKPNPNNIFKNTATGGNIELLHDATYQITINVNTTNYTVSSINISITSYTYTVKIGSVTYGLKNTSSANYDKEWTATVNAIAGKEMMFKNAGEEMEVGGNAASNNNYNQLDGTILSSSENVALYLQLKGTTYTVWLAGRAVDYYLYAGGDLIPMEVNPDNNSEFMVTGVAITAGASVRFYGGELFDATIKENSSENWSLVDSKPTAAKAGVFDFYLAPSLEGNVVFIAGQTNATAQAEAYSIHFLTTLQGGENPICHDESKEEVKTNLEDLINAWADLKQDYIDDVTDADARTILQNADVEGNGMTNRFAALYDHIVKAYGTQLGAGYNFVNRSTTGSNMMFALENGSNTVVVITIISSVSLIAVASFFMLKKKKESK